MRDIDHIETIQRKWLYDRISRVADRYGFQGIDPSPMERLETLEAKSGPAIKNEIYCFKDKAGRDLGLRFDLTVGMTRMVASRRDLPEPIKLYAISGMWRYDEPQFARYRYFHQWDMEIYGSEDSMADAETISASMDILEELGLKDHEMLINNRVIIDGFLQNYKLSDEERMRVLRIIDKSRKTSREVIIGELNNLGIKGDSLTKLMEFTSISGTPEKTLDKLESYKSLDQQALEGIETVIIENDFLNKQHKEFVDKKFEEHGLKSVYTRKLDDSNPNIHKFLHVADCFFQVFKKSVSPISLPTNRQTTVHFE